MTTQHFIHQPIYRWHLRSGLTLLWVLTLTLGLIQPTQAQTATPGYVLATGLNDEGQSTVPASLSAVKAIAAGDRHSLALKNDGTVVAWGSNGSGQLNIPTGLSGVIAIAAGTNHSLALKNDGTVVAWGSNGSGQLNIPTGLSNVIAIAAGNAHSLALKRDGTVVAWGNNSFGQLNIPTGLSNVTALAAGYYHSLALKRDGTVIAWGDDIFGQNNIPAGLSNVTAIAASGNHDLALKRDGTVVAWGNNTSGEGNIPAGLSGVRAIAAGEAHSLALKNDGSVVGWGSNFFGQLNIPNGLRNVTAIAGGRYHSLALSSVNDFAPPTANPFQLPAADNNGWTDRDVTVNWRWRDNTGGSGLDTTHCTTSSKSSGEGIQTLTATCQDKVGNVGSASYIVKVDKTAPAANPTQSPAANAAGWNNTNVTVNWNWTDPSPNAGTGSGIDPAYCETTSDSHISNGAETLTASCFDQVGHVTTASYTVKVDRAWPQIRSTVSPAASGFGWYASAVTVSFTCQEQGTGSGLAINTVGGNTTLSTEGIQPAVTNTGTCTDKADNVATSVTVGPFNIDLTKPTISAAATTQPNANGWYNQNVTVHFTCTDALSGLAYCPPDETLSSEGAAVASTAQTGRDKAQNVSDPSNVVAVKLDKTAPGVTVTGVSNGATYLAGSVPAAICTTSDALSTVATQATPSVSGGNPDGSGTFTATCSGATDKAGNSAAPISVSYLVLAAANSSVTQQNVNAVYNAALQPCPASGSSLSIHAVTPTLRNTSTKSYSNLVFKVKTLEYSTAQAGQQPVLCNASSGNGGVGSQFTIANSSLPGSNSQFNPGEELLPVFQIGLPVRAPYRFFVDLYSVSVTAAADGEAQDGEYLGSFVYTFDVNDQGGSVNQLFLPLISR